MNGLTALNAFLSRWTMYASCACLTGLLSVVVYGVVLRYAFNAAPPYVEQLALLLVVSVAMLGATAGVRDAGHIGLDSAVARLPEQAQFICRLLVQVFGLCFAMALLIGGAEMAASTRESTIPTLGLSEAVRYVPVMIAGVFMALFSIEHLLAQFTGEAVNPSWH